jgi:hypothetical protein
MTLLVRLNVEKEKDGIISREQTLNVAHKPLPGSWKTIFVAGCGASKEGCIVNQRTTLIRVIVNPSTRSLGIVS